MNPARICPLSILILLTAILPARAADATQPPPTNAAIVTVAGEINDYTRDQLFRDVDSAKKLGAKVVIINIDSYGGLLTSGLEMSRFIKRQDDVHTIAYVQDKAISAGSMIAMACNEIVMSDSASLGDCAPIIFGPSGLESMAPTERAKAQAPVLLDFNESADRNHHDPLLASAMVDIGNTVYWVQNDKGEKRFVDEADHTQLLATKKWVDVPGAPDPIVGPQALLTVDSAEAVKYGLASAQYSTLQDLEQARNYKLVADFTPGWTEEAVEFLGGAVVRGILIVIFLQCLYIVLHAPGHGVAETCGLVALVLMLGVPLLTGYAQWWEILVIFAGLSLISLEILLPGHIFPGVIGGLLALFGLVMTFVPADVNGPSYFPNQGNLRLVERGLIVVAAAMASSVFLWFWLNRFLPKLPLLNRLILTGAGPTTSAPAANHPAEDTSEKTMRWPPRGAMGKAVSELRPGGTAEFFDPTIADKRIAFVVSESGYLSAGTNLVVREVDEPSIIVRKAEVAV